MSTAAKPFMKFYPQDWRADEKLRNCSLAARGLWMELLALMHRSQAYGVLLVGDNAPSIEQLAVQVGASPEQVSALLAELELQDVFSRNRAGEIYSRRMIRDEKRAKIARNNGKTGGNPKLTKQSENPTRDNQQDKPSDKTPLNTQRPEARGQKEKAACASPSAAMPDDLRQVMQAASMISPPPDAALLRDWLSEGINLKETIIPVVQRLAERENDRGRPVGKLKYFDQAIRAEHAADQAYTEHLRGVVEDFTLYPAGEVGPLPLHGTK